MYVALRKVGAPGDGLGLRTLSRVIDRCSGRGGYYHAALLLPTTMYSLSSQPGRGVLWEHLPTGFPVAEWSVFDIRRQQHEDRVREFFLGEVGCGYDYAGVLRFVVPDLRPSKRRWFCSELVVACMQRAGLFEQFEPSLISPNDLARHLGLLAKLTEYTDVRQLC